MLVRRSGVQSVFQFIPKVFSGVEVRALCRTLEFFHSNLNTPCLHGARFVHRGIVMLEQFIPKVFSGVEVRALCRTLEFFHSNLNTPCLHGARFVHRGIVMLEQVVFHDVNSLTEKLFPIVEAMQKHFSAGSGAYYSDAIFFLSVAMHRIMPTEYEYRANEIPWLTRKLGSQRRVSYDMVPLEQRWLRALLKCPTAAA
ncbi:hypothetical protein PGIGA_G00030000 [Pangasianodon gigas]|uniref:Uncharacterized protein n=1 Tax=Pangasianodon gigas TaxID=30993 RepID=A0ACC5WYE9_PANGG|nr:hypothetical protein [Pangasianodon gigas]